MVLGVVFRKLFDVHTHTHTHPSMFINYGKVIFIHYRHGANAKIPDINGNLPLHSATIHHQVAAVTELLKYSDALTVSNV